MDWQINRPTKHCVKTGRDLNEGETFYTVLEANGADWKRSDYAREAWTGPPEGAVAWWKSQIPTRESTRARMAPTEVLLQFFEELAAGGHRPDMLYVLTLLLLRRRVLRLEEAEHHDDPQPEMVVHCLRNEQTYHVPTLDLDDAQTREIQTELERLLVVSG